MLKKVFEYPIDCILKYHEDIIVCSYHFESNKQIGKIQVLDANSFKIKFEEITTGTLHASTKNNFIYLANSKDISLFKNNKLFKRIPTNFLNTYLFLGDCVYISNINGEINMYDFELNHIKQIKITQHPIWIVKQNSNSLFFGDESGRFFVYNLSNSTFEEIKSNRQGVIEIHFSYDKFMIFSYDNFFEIYDIVSLKLLEKVDNMKSIWRIVKHLDFYFCACMYDGLIILNLNFNIVKQIKTKSVCYGVCKTDSGILFSSFYDKELYYLTYDEILNF